MSRMLRTQGVTAPEGFRAAGIAAGIKASGNLDLALVFNEGRDYFAAGVFTRNKVKAAPVLWSQQVLTTGRLCAVIHVVGGAELHIHHAVGVDVDHDRAGVDVGAGIADPAW